MTACHLYLPSCFGPAGDGLLSRRLRADQLTAAANGSVVIANSWTAAGKARAAATVSRRRILEGLRAFQLLDEGIAERIGRKRLLPADELPVLDNVDLPRTNTIHVSAGLRQSVSSVKLNRASELAFRTFDRVLFAGREDSQPIPGVRPPSGKLACAVEIACDDGRTESFRIAQSGKQRRGTVTDDARRPSCGMKAHEDFPERFVMSQVLHRRMAARDEDANVVRRPLFDDGSKRLGVLEFLDALNKLKVLCASGIVPTEEHLVV